MIITEGSVDVSAYYYILDKTTGLPVTGLLYSDIETGGSASYTRQGEARTDLTLITLASSSAAHSDGGFILVDDTNFPGLYRCDYPDAAFVTGVDQVSLQVVIEGSKNAIAIPIIVDIVSKEGYSLASTGLDAIASTATGMVEIAKAIWDRVITKANHNIAQSAGKELRSLASIVIRTETAQGPGTGDNQIQFDTGASSMDGAYDPAIVAIIAGTGEGQARRILQYDGTSKTATVNRNWKMNPDATSEFNIIADAGGTHVNEGLAQAGTSTTVTLNTLASPDDNAYEGQMVFVMSGTGEDQARLVLSYDGTTKIASLDRPWERIPNTTSGYVMLPSSPVLLAALTQASIDNIEAGTISATAAGNLEDTYDGTGYENDKAPATQAQIGLLSTGVSGGGAINATGVVITTGTETLTFEATHEEDGVVHEVAAVGGNTDFYYEVTLGGTQVATDVTWRGYVSGILDSVELQFYHWGDAAFKTELVLPGAVGTTLIEETIRAVNAYTGTGANLGKVRFRFLSTTANNIATDRLRFDFVTNFDSVGYALGRIWVNTLSGKAGVVAFFNGVADRPVLTLADALTLSSSVGLTDFHTINGSIITLEGISDNFSFFGDHWTLALNNKSVSGTYFQGASEVSGICTGTEEVHFEGCDIDSISVQLGHFDFCGFRGTVTQTLAGDYNYHDCYSKVPGAAAPTFTKTAGQAVTIQFRRYSGGITLSGLEAGDVITVSGELGTVTLNGADATVEVRGTYKELVNNLTGSPTVNTDGAIKGVDVASILADTNELQTDWTDGGRLDLILDSINGVWTTAMTESYAADGSAMTPSQVLYMIWSDLRSPAQVGTTWTDYKIDNVTAAMTFTLDDADIPTSKTRAT